MLKELALQIGPLRRLYEHRNHLLGELDAARQASGRTSSPFFHYAANFDALGTMRRYAAANLQPTPGLVTNWLGVKVEPKVYPPALAERAGTVEPVPIPANWHADIAEWAAVLQASGQRER